VEGEAWRAFPFFFFLDSGVGGRITVEKRGSNRVVLGICVSEPSKLFFSGE